jgi:transposase-like protein
LFILLGKASLNCHCCQGETKRFGKFQNKNRLVQRFRCVRCGKTFSESQPLEGVKVETAKVVQVVKLLTEGLGSRATSRLTSLDQKTVLNILETVGAQCAEMLDQRILNIKPEPLEVDECWTMVAHKRAKGNTPSKGDFYAFLASGKHTKLIASWYVGKRNNADCLDFVDDIRARTQSPLQVTSDGWVGFIRGFYKSHREDTHYATQVKQYAGYNVPIDGGRRRYGPGKCVSVQTTVMLGNPDPEHITTSHAERLNLSLRHFNKRFTRLSPCFSKKLENLIHSVALTVAYFNFCRVHSALKIPATETEKAIHRTPAQAAGLTDHVWTVEELLLTSD